MNVPKQISLKTSLIFVVASILLTSLVFYAFATTPSSTFYISSGIYPGAPSYTVWQEGSYYFAKDDNGLIAYSGTNASLVIQSVFNQNPLRVFFKEAVYDLDDHNIEAYVPIVIEGEGKESTIKDGMLKVIGVGDFAANWGDNINVVRCLNFESDGDVINLWFVNVTHGIIEKNRFRKFDFALGVANLCLTDSWTIRVRDNWFDGYNCQIIHINGTFCTAPLHRINDNDFGSTTLGGFPALGDPDDIWQAAAIFIEEANNWGVNIADNLAVMHDGMIFVYSEAGNTIVKNNEIQCAGTGQFAIDLQAAENLVEGNTILVSDTAGGAIANRRTGDLELVMMRTRICDNLIKSNNATDPIFGVMQQGIISDNIIYGWFGITLNNSANNLLVGNQLIRSADHADYGFREVGACDTNTIIGMVALWSRIYTTGPNTYVHLSWNGTVWIP